MNKMSTLKHDIFVSRHGKTIWEKNLNRSKAK